MDNARAQLDQRRADLEKAQADVARYVPLAEARAIPQQDLDTARSQEKVAAAGVEVGEAALRDTELVQRTQIQLAEAAVESAKASVTQAELNLATRGSPRRSAASSARSLVDPGNLVGKSDPTLLTQISAVDPIFVEFSVAEADYLRLASRSGWMPGRGRRERRLDLFLADDSHVPAQGPLRVRGSGLRREDGHHQRPGGVPEPDAGAAARPVRAGARGRGRAARRRARARSAPCRSSRAPRSSWSWPRTRSPFRPVTLDERVGDALHRHEGPQAGRARHRRGRPEGAARHAGESRDPRDSSAHRAGGHPPRRATPPGPRPPARRRPEARGVAEFFIRRPIVAIVISILMVLHGGVRAHAAQLRAVPVPRARRRSASRRTTRAPPPWPSSSPSPRRSSRRSTASIA